MKKLLASCALISTFLNPLSADAALYGINNPPIIFTSPDTLATLSAAVCEDFNRIIDGDNNIDYWQTNCASGTPTYTQIWPVRTSDVVGLTTALSGKFDTPTGTSSQVILGDGTYAPLPSPGVTLPINESDVTSLVTDLAAKAPTSRTVNGHALTGNVSVSAADLSLGNVVNLDTSTTSNITDSTNKRFVTDAQKTLLANTSGINTGDQDLSGLVGKTVTVNGHALSANVTVTASDVGLGNVNNTADASKTFAASQITSGTFADARIAQSSVIQYQSALSIATSQITGTKTSSFISDFASAARALFSVTGNGSYDSSTGIITVGAPTLTFNYPSRALNSCFQISSTQDADFHYKVDVTTGLSLTAGAQGTVTATSYTNSACSTGAQAVADGTSAQSGTLIVGLGISQIGDVSLDGTLPKNRWLKLTTANTTGTPSFILRTVQSEVLR